MRNSRFILLTACLFAGATTTFASTNGTSPRTSTRAYPAQKLQSPLQKTPQIGAVAAPSIAPQSLVGGTSAASPSLTPGTLAAGTADSCASPDLISGNGAFPFDLTAATQSPEGQASGCGSIYADIWYEWTATATGTAQVTLCGTASNDSKIAAYAGAGCPAGASLACNDDSCGLQSQISFAVTAGSVYMLQIGAYSVASIGAGSFSVNVAGAATNDDCASATAISGAGTFAFSNLGATTGPQQGLACGSGTCNNDVWFDWTAPSSGNAVWTLCNGLVGFDSLIAAYAGSGCPTGAALGCNDDSCGLVSRLVFPVTGGNHYMLQIGAYGAAGSGSGSFDISVNAPPTGCTYDDGSTENLLGWTAGGDMVWLNTFGSAAGTNVVSSVDVMWGSALYTGYNPGNGTPTNIFIYADGPTQDGNPTDATLLLTIPTTVSAVDTDTYVHYTFAPLTITGFFFVGSQEQHVAGQYVAPIDMSIPQPNVAWFFGDNTPGATANYANPGANVQVPFTIDSIGIPGQFMVRAGCSSGPATYLCDPGAGGVIACPCANPPAGAGRGCDNSSATGGATISGAGNNSLASPSVVFTTGGEKPTATTILLQGTASIAGGVAFGQGVRCTGGALKRLYVKNAVGGSITAPGVGDADIPTQSATLGDPISAGTSRWYMAYYRDPIVLGGCAVLATFNATPTAEVLWNP